ncbi:MAG TPA: pyridoxal-dependent decarboxylase [Terriglobales bacterium]|nr:pyridoxal-dependent decarboxylase [Terriglobales bacterium]
MNPLELSPNQVRDLADDVLNLVTEYLSTLHQRAVFPSTSGAETERLFAGEVPENGMGDASLDALAGVIAHSRAQNGRFFGYVQGSADPVAALGDFVTSVLNQNMTAWRSAPAGVTIERTVVRWLAEAVGCGGFSGTLTGGGSAANLMALAMARESKTPANDRGMFGGEVSVIYASEQVHMSIPKAVAMLGIGRENIHYVPCDEAYRMLPSELNRAIATDKAQGRKPIAVVASAGTVNTGSIDPLTQIAAIARAHDLWLHIDGAYGALAALAVPEKFHGIAEADSLSLDPHKWLFQPLDCGFLLYRDAEIARKTFAYTGAYAKQLSSDPVEGFAFFEESMELSRRFRALKLWLSLRYHGLQAFRAAIRMNLDQAQRLATAIKARHELELCGPVELSAVCFRHIISDDATEEARNDFNLKLLKKLVSRGRVYLSNAELNGRFCLRACIVNHLTTSEDIDTVIPQVLAAASEELASRMPDCP